MTQPFIYLGQVSTFTDSAEQAVVRETREELATEIRAERKLCMAANILDKSFSGILPLL